MEDAYQVTEADVDSVLRSGLEALRRAVPRSQHRWTPFAFERQENGAVQSQPSSRPDALRFLLGSVTRNDGFGNGFATKLRSDPLYERQRVANEKARSELEVEPGRPRYGMWGVLADPESVAAAILSEYVRLSNSLEYQSEIAKRVALSFLQALDELGSEWVCFSFVRGLFGELPPIPLPNDVTLRKLGDDELASLLNEAPSLYDQLVQSDHALNNQWIVERRLCIPAPGLAPETTETTERFHTVLTALRMLKPAQVDIEGSYLMPVRRLSLAHGGVQFQFPGTRRFGPIATYELKTDDVPQLTSLVKFLSRGNTPKRLIVAIDRLNFSARRDRPDDKLLDLAIALEALFGDSEGAHSYKIALRSAVYMTHDPAERESIAQLVTASFKDRNALVHGGARNDQEKAQSTERVQRLEGLVRDALRRLAEQIIGGSRLPDVKDLDKLLLRGEQLMTSQAGNRIS